MTTDRPSGLRLGLLAGLAHAVLFVLAFPPFGLDLLALVAIVPLIIASGRPARPWRTAAGVWLASMLAWGYLHRWIWTNDVTGPGFILLTMLMASYPALFVALLAQVRRRKRVALWIAAPVLWSTLEFLRGHVVFHGYPWFLLGHPLADRALIAAYAPAVGAYGVSFIVAWLNTALAMALSRVARRPRLRMAPRWIGGGAALAAVLVGGLLLHARAGRLLIEASRATPAMRIAVVQTNVPQSNKRSSSFEDLERTMAFLLDRTEAAAGSDPKPDLVAWPETMYPGYFGISSDSMAEQRRVGINTVAWHDAMLVLQSRLRVPIIVGSEALDGLRLELDEQGRLGDFGWDARFNSAFLVDDGAVQPQRYDKMFLTPFGEVMPYLSAWPWLEKQVLALGAAGMAFDLSAGRAPTALPVRTHAGTVPVATPICFEATMPAVCRRLVFDRSGARTARVMVNLTNDGWFGAARGGRENHLLAARWRCMELATPMVRAANTGISASIDATGRVVRLGPDGREPDARPDRIAGTMTATVTPAIGGRTLYARTGEWPMWGMTLVGLAMWAAAALGTKKPTPIPAPTAPAQDRTA